MTVAGLKGGVKTPKSQHFDDATLGAMLEKVFDEEGASIEVDNELAGISIPYQVRMNQLALDFATRLADRNNAIFKSAGGRYLFVPRGRQ